MILGLSSFGETAFSDIPIVNQTIVQAGLSSNITLAEEGIFIVNAGDLAIVLSGQSLATGIRDIQTDFAILIEQQGLNTLTSAVGSEVIDLNTPVDISGNRLNSVANIPFITGWSRVETSDDEAADRDKWRGVDIAA